MPRYQSKPVQVEAVQWRGDNDHEMANFAHGFRRAGSEAHVDCGPPEGWWVINPGWWAVKVAPKRIVVVSDEAFADTYEPADQGGEAS